MYPIYGINTLGIRQNVTKNFRKEIKIIEVIVSINNQNLAFPSIYGISCGNTVCGVDLGRKQRQRQGSPYPKLDLLSLLKDLTISLNSSSSIGSSLSE